MRDGEGTPIDEAVLNPGMQPVHVSKIGREDILNLAVDERRRIAMNLAANGDHVAADIGMRA